MPALPTLQAVDVATLQEALQQYPDSAEASYIPIESGEYALSLSPNSAALLISCIGVLSVEIFLLKNNIRASS